MTRRNEIKLSETALSVFEADAYELAEDPESFGLDEDETAAYQALAACVDLDRAVLVLPESAQERRLVADLLTDLANGYDDVLECERDQWGPEELRFAATARRVMTSLASKVCLAGSARNPSMLDDTLRSIREGTVLTVQRMSHYADSTAPVEKVSKKAIKSVEPVRLYGGEGVGLMVTLKGGGKLRTSAGDIDKPYRLVLAANGDYLLTALPPRPVKYVVLEIDGEPV